MGYQRKIDSSILNSSKLVENKMSDNLMDVITLCDYETCPTVKCDNEGHAMIVVKSDGESQSVNGCIDHSFESHQSRAIGAAHR